MATDWLEVANNASGTLSADITSGATTLTLDAGQGAEMPAGFPYDLTLDSEILRVTDRSADTLTITRAQQGTSAAAHSAGAEVELRVTAGIVSQIQGALGTLEDGAALLAGRSGGQTLIGGTGASDDLILESTAHATKGDIKAIVGTSFFVETPTSLTGTTNTAIQIGSGQTVSLGAGGGVRALGFLPNINIEGDPTGVMALLFGFSSQVTLGASAAYDLNGTRIFTNQPTYNMSSGIADGSLGSGSTLPMTGFWDGPTYADGPGGATGTVDNVTSFRQALSVGAGWTLTNLRGLHVLAAGGSASGAIGTHVGVDVEDLDSFAGTTTNPSLSLRSIGAAVELRHAGPGVFGANAAPSNASVGLEVQSTTRAFRLPNMTTTQRDALTALVGMKIYNTTTGKEQVYANPGGAGAAWTDTH
jgi:hypothetical protein